jgi:membrane protein required for colicin V production
MAGMNHLDYAIVAIIVLGGFYGLTRGMLRMATSILSVGLGIIAAAIWYERAAALIEPHLPANSSVGAGTLASVIGYIAVFVVVAAAIEFAGRRIVRLAHIMNLNWLDRLGGAVFGAALAAAFAGIDVVLLTAVLRPDSTLLRDSQLAPRVLAYNDSLLACVPAQVKDLYEQKHEELIRYWSAQNESPAPTPERAKSGT